MFISEKAFVLHQVKYNETSLITTLLSASHGRLSCISKGIRTVGKNYKANILEPGNLIQIDLKYIPNKSLQLLQDFKMISTISEGLYSPVRQSIVTYMMEFLYKSLHHEEPQTVIFGLTESYFHFLKSNALEKINVVPVSFTLEVLQALGYATEQWKWHSSDLPDSLPASNADRLRSLIHYVSLHHYPLQNIKSVDILSSVLHY